MPISKIMLRLYHILLLQSRFLFCPKLIKKQQLRFKKLVLNHIPPSSEFINYYTNESSDSLFLSVCICGVCVWGGCHLIKEMEREI